jgi:hypothetical protein
VGRPDELKGQALVAFVTLKMGRSRRPSSRASWPSTWPTEIGKFAKPDAIRFTRCAAEDAQRQDHAPASSKTSTGAGHPPTGRTPPTLEDLTSAWPAAQQSGKSRTAQAAAERPKESPSVGVLQRLGVCELRTGKLPLSSNVASPGIEAHARPGVLVVAGGGGMAAAGPLPRIGTGTGGGWLGS